MAHVGGASPSTGTEHEPGGTGMGCVAPTAHTTSMEPHGSHVTARGALEYLPAGHGAKRPVPTCAATNRRAPTITFRGNVMFNKTGGYNFE